MHKPNPLAASAADATRPLTSTETNMETARDDVATVNDLRLAAIGDGQAQLRLAQTARRLVLAEIADDIVGSIEGVCYARLAAAQGIPDALLLLADHCAHLAGVYYECEAQECGDEWIAQSLGVLELATEVLPASNAAELMDQLTATADCATPEIMAATKYFRDLFAPAFGAAAFA